jgi:hypothetical protein
MTAFVIVNQCSDAALTPELLAQIAAALDVQLNRDLAPHWGGWYRVRAATPDAPPAAGEVVALITDDLPDAPGAVAYHDWTGQPNIYIGRNLCSSLIDGELSVSQGLSHELCEESGDVACNIWADDGTGTEWAHELCDAVEGGWYKIGDVAVSDFVLPSFFAPGALPPYSYLQAHDGTGPSAPFLTAAGGYQIKRASGTGETQVTAETPQAMHAMRRTRKRHWSSRTFRRGVRL